MLCANVTKQLPINFTGIPPNPRQDSCYRFNENSNSWSLHCTMTVRRNSHAATVIHDTLFISGGNSGNFTHSSTLASTEFIHANGSVTSGPNLPEARLKHCMVTLHDSKVMIIGGYSPVLVFDTADNSYTTGPSMSYSRSSLACTLFHSDMHNGRPVVLAAGGSFKTTIEVYDYTNSNQWETSIHLNISNM
jgi:hypothetical protein